MPRCPSPAPHVGAMLPRKANTDAAGANCPRPRHAARPSTSPEHCAAPAALNALGASADATRRAARRAPPDIPGTGTLCEIAVPRRVNRGEFNSVCSGGGGFRRRGHFLCLTWHHHEVWGPATTCPHDQRCRTDQKGEQACKGQREPQVTAPPSPSPRSLGKAIPLRIRRIPRLVPRTECRANGGPRGLDTHSG